MPRGKSLQLIYLLRFLVSINLSSSSEELALCGPLNRMMCIRTGTCSWIPMYLLNLWVFLNLLHVGGDIPISILTGHQEYPEHHHNQVGGFVSLFSGGLNGDCLRKFYFIALPEYFSRFPNIAKDYHNGTLTSASESIHLKIMCAFALLL
uniref:Uncharacterized protein n=1 Tax=Physcomitrium patens TaxID=3218 RepID=A0A7I4BR33_PHYPA